jgi:type IV pilus assembly protein PilC
MGRFSYVVRDKDGNRQTGVEEATDSDTLIIKLQAQGLLVVEVKPYEKAVSESRESIKKAVVTTHGKAKTMDLVIFARQLATMLDAGVNLMRSLQIISQQVESAALLKTLEQMSRDLIKGSSFSKSLAQHPKIFGQFWVSLAEVGEASGNLPVILEKLADYMEAKANFQSKVVSAILYPSVLLFVSIGALGFFAAVIVPKFSEIFVSMNINLPPLTKLILGTFDFVKSKFILLFAGIVAIIFLFKRYINTKVGRWQLESVLFKIPIYGNFYRIMIIERFTSQLAILIESGVPILYALEISERMVINEHMSKVIEGIKNQVREGKLIAEPMNKSGFFTPMAVQMVLIGEETGELDKMLNKVAYFYQRNIETFISRLSTLIEPLMLVFMGAVVGVIVISMFLPIFSLATGGMGG